MARLVAALLVLVMLGVSLVLYVQLDRPVSRVVVRGPLDEAERGQIQNAVRSHLDGGLLSADLDALGEGILNLNWPRSISIRRDWPGTLDIEVEKPAVVARWQDAYLASDGRVVRLPSKNDSLPRFDCATAEPQRAMEIFHGLNEPARRVGLAIETLMEDELGEWTVALRSPAAEKLTVKLGAESVQERLERFLLVYRAQLVERVEEIAAVDARYDNGVAVRWLTEDDVALVATTAVPASESI